ncbi:L-asparaginase precursor [Corynebacterium occultum]|uniref:asparaginase n=1 Tax=Corynebacterium occultum TaxID=2675219 RepID=A0A6B8W5F4_9CORY|nr:asparaginase [Corynebacterium occultum]QGU07791.1 L-asparaginase precursor [Corynebacterium occultum]
MSTSPTLNQASLPAPAAVKIVVLSTGGTIACTRGPEGSLIPTVSGEELVSGLRSRFDPASTTFEVRELNRLDSSSMTLADVDEIITAVHRVYEDPEVSGVVVTHGTDTMEETAVAVDVFHTDPRPVVFTGSQLPFDHPEGDGPENLFEAAVVAADPAARGIGTLIVFGHAVLPARGATKVHTSALNGFGSTAPAAHPRPRPLPTQVPLRDVRVDIIAAWPGAPRTQVDAALAEGAQGLVVAALGAGNVGTELGVALGEALDAGVAVVISTRVAQGEVHGSYGGAGGGATLAAKGALGSAHYRPGQARMLLAAALAAGVDPAAVFQDSGM